MNENILKNKTMVNPFDYPITGSINLEKSVAFEAFLVAVENANTLKEKQKLINENEKNFKDFEQFQGLKESIDTLMTSSFARRIFNDFLDKYEGKIRKDIMREFKKEIPNDDIKDLVYRILNKQFLIFISCFNGFMEDMEEEHHELLEELKKDPKNKKIIDKIKKLPIFMTLGEFDELLQKDA